jgi:hypothetical protein
MDDIKKTDPESVPEKKEGAGAEAVQAGTAPAQPGLQETATKSGQPGAGGAPGQQDPGVDKAGKKETARKKGTDSGKTATADPKGADLEREAAEIFAKHAIDTVFMTPDGLGFAARADAEAHARTLGSQKVEKFERGK